MEKKKVLFVCIENSNRSQIAQAFALIHGKEHVEAFSAGSRPSGKINPKAIAAMKELGYDLTAHRSKSLQDLPEVTFDQIVTMGCGDECPHIPSRSRVDWQIPDPKDLDESSFRDVRKMIEEKVLALLSELDSPDLRKPH